MKSIRECHISGNLVKTPVSVKTKTGKDLTFFTVACNYNVGSEKRVTYIELEAWDSMAIYCSKHLEKGNFISVKANLKQDRWEKDGVYQDKTHLSVFELNNISLQYKMIEDSSELKEAV